MINKASQKLYGYDNSILDTSVSDKDTSKKMEMDAPVRFGVKEEKRMRTYRPSSILELWPKPLASHCSYISTRLLEQFVRCAVLKSLTMSHRLSTEKRHSVGVTYVSNVLYQEGNTIIAIIFKHCKSQCICSWYKP